MPGLLQAHRGTSSEAAARAIAATSSSAQAHHGQPDPELLAEIGGGSEVGMVVQGDAGVIGQQRFDV